MRFKRTANHLTAADSSSGDEEYHPPGATVPFHCLGKVAVAITSRPMRGLGVAAVFDSDTGTSQNRPKRKASRMTETGKCFAVKQYKPAMPGGRRAESLAD